MGLWDDARNLGLAALGTVGGVVNEWAGSALRKADTESQESGPGGSQQDSAKSNPVPTKPAADDPKSLFWDPFAIIEQLGYKDRPSQITYGTLRAIAWKNPILQAVIQTRVQQVASFCMPQHDRYQLGFRIKLRESDKEPTKKEREWMKQMETVFTRTGVTDNPRGRQNFETFLRKLAWDSLVFDQMCYEIVPNRKGEPAEWYAVDASTIRLADSASTFIDEDETKAVRTVQVYDGVVINEYTQDELVFGVRNPRTDIRLYGYGVSELEMLVPCVTSLLYAWEYNQRFFSQGSAAKGIINFKGVVPENQLQQFRRHWYQMISGVENAWKTPITNSDELQYINLQQSSRDMEYNAWMDFLIKVACSMYQMDPLEVNFKYGNAGQKSGLQEASNKEKITESKERGLRPLLRFIANSINTNILWPINENFEFAFVGLDAKTQDELADLNSKRVKTMMTVDEIRAEDDLPPLPDGKGEVILEPTWLQWAQIKEGGMEGGGFGEEGGDMGEGEADNEGGGDQGEEGPPNEGGGGEENEGPDFEGMLAKYGAKPGKPGEAAKPAQRGEGAKNENTEKSLSRKWVVNL